MNNQVTKNDTLTLDTIKQLETSLKLKDEEYIRKALRDKYIPSMEDFKNLHIVFNPSMKDKVPIDYDWVHSNDYVEGVIIFDDKKSQIPKFEGILKWK